MIVTYLVVLLFYLKLFRAGGYKFATFFLNSIQILEQSISEAETIRAFTQ